MNHSPQLNNSIAKVTTFFSVYPVPSMAIVLLKFIFLALSAISNLITRLIFTAAAQVLVQMIQALKIPSEGSQRLLEQVRNGIRACLDYLLELITEAIGTVIFSFFGLLKEGVLNSSFGLIAALTGLMEKSKTSLDGMVEEFPEVLNAFREMVSKMVMDFLNNFSDAIAYVSENVLN